MTRILTERVRELLLGMQGQRQCADCCEMDPTEVGVASSDVTYHEGCPKPAVWGNSEVRVWFPLVGREDGIDLLRDLLDARVDVTKARLDLADNDLILEERERQLNVAVTAYHTLVDAVIAYLSAADGEDTHTLDGCRASLDEVIGSVK